MITHQDLGWLAGIIDGEGSITTQVLTRKTGNICITPFVTIINNDSNIINECSRILNELGFKHKWYGRKNSNVFNMRLEKQERVKQFLIIIRDYLRSYKKEHAEVILEFIESRERTLLKRGEKGRIVRNKYARKEIELINSIRRHHHAKSLEYMLSAPNVEE
jgi:hypothetical protein